MNNDDPTILFSRDAAALDLMREYSALCARAAHEPSRENFLAAEAKRDQILARAERQQFALSAAITKVVNCARVAAGPHDEGYERAEAERDLLVAEVELRQLIGIA